jgi:uncharacterized protein YukE
MSPVEVSFSTGGMLQLSVAPDDLPRAAGVLDSLANRLTAALADFDRVAASCAPRLGAKAVEASFATSHSAGAATRTLMANYATAGEGLRAIAARYADTDAHAIGAAR